MDVKAKELVAEFYYSITNDGTSEGCDLAYKNAINCALVSVKKMLSEIERNKKECEEVKKELEAMK